MPIAYWSIINHDRRVGGISGAMIYRSRKTVWRSGVEGRWDEAHVSNSADSLPIGQRECIKSRALRQGFANDALKSVWRLAAAAS